MQKYVTFLDIKYDADLLDNFIKALDKILLIGNRVLVNGTNIMLEKFMEYGGIAKL